MISIAGLVRVAIVGVREGTEDRVYVVKASEPIEPSAPTSSRSLAKRSWNERRWLISAAMYRNFVARLYKSESTGLTTGGRPQMMRGRSGLYTGARFWMVTTQEDQISRKGMKATGQLASERYMSCRGEDKDCSRGNEGGLVVEFSAAK